MFDLKLISLLLIFSEILNIIIVFLGIITYNYWSYNT